MLLLALSLAWSQDVSPPPATPPRAADLAWLSGSWSREQAGHRVEELWSTPAGGTLMGTSRTVKDGATAFYEYLRIEERDGALVYVAWPKGATQPTDFGWTAGGDTWARFENPSHDFPTSLVYRLTGTQLHIEVRGPDGKGFDVDLAREAPER